MDAVDYKRIRKYCARQAYDTQVGEDVLHDSIVTALEKNRYDLGYIIGCFKYRKRTFFRDSSIQRRNEEFYYLDETPNRSSPTNYGEALDTVKAIEILTTAVKKRFSYRKRSNRVDAFIKFYLWKEDAALVAKELKSTPASIRNVCYDTVKKLSENKNLVPYLELMSSEVYNRQKTNTSRASTTERIAYSKKGT